MGLILTAENIGEYSYLLYSIEISNTADQLRHCLNFMRFFQIHKLIWLHIFT